MYGFWYHEMEMPRLTIRRESFIRQGCEHYLGEKGPKVAKQLIGIFYSGHRIDREQFLGIFSSEGVAGLIRHHNYLINPT